MVSPRRIWKLLRHVLTPPPPRALLRDRFPVGRGTYGEPHIRQFGEQTTLKIGAFCSIADGVSIFLGGEHRVDWITTYPFTVFRPSAQGITGHPKSKGDVIIGNDVWLGEGCTILSGVNIGDGAVVGARSLVTKDVAPYMIVGGNPAKTIRKRFTDEQIDSLQEIQWWNWPDETLDKAMPILLSGNIEGLAAFAKSQTR